MIVVRAVQPGDVDTLLRLAGETGPGMTTFKPDRDALAERVERVRRTVRGEAARHEAGYLFVMEDSETGDVAGVCGIEVEVGLEQPFYTYRVSTLVHASKELGTYTRMRALNISYDLTGYAEVCSLFLSPRYRSGGVGGLLSRSRFMFLAQFQERFPERICAEMRGHFDEEGQSPFWRSVAAPFYQVDFEEADKFVSLGRKSFLAELMPRHPVYVELLPEEAQRCIGIVHKDTVPARRLLESEGFRFENQVDIFEGGPALECHIADLRTVRESVVVPTEIADVPLGAPKGAPRSLVSNTSLDDFRVGMVAGTPQDGVFRISAREAAALNVKTGESVRVLPAN